MEDERRLRYFDESREHLHLVEIHGTTKFDVHEMETDYSRWFMKYQVDLNSIIIAFPRMIARGLNPSDRYYYKLVVLSIIREVDDGESYMVLQIPNKAIRYNLNNKTFNKIFDFPSRREGVESHPASQDFECHLGRMIHNWFAHPYQHIETLVCI
ncbi:hypothetical protein Ddye_013260 [Dipteronia dyeriana]|uniref:Uncharacterized protein n=1 Tax=Dipteronia dyeriana TaxID=168575 RepID=A0AAD9X5Z0_9ROSI|nr:hypothetical protein Ddye_013260 [Dipteronia dyeriana]